MSDVAHRHAAGHDHAPARYVAGVIVDTPARRAAAAAWLARRRGVEATLFVLVLAGLLAAAVATAGGLPDVLGGHTLSPAGRLALVAAAVAPILARSTLRILRARGHPDYRGELIGNIRVVAITLLVTAAVAGGLPALLLVIVMMPELADTAALAAVSPRRRRELADTVDAHHGRDASHDAAAAADGHGHPIRGDGGGAAPPLLVTRRDIGERAAVGLRTLPLDDTVRRHLDDVTARRRATRTAARLLEPLTLAGLGLAIVGADAAAAALLAAAAATLGYVAAAGFAAPGPLRRPTLSLAAAALLAVAAAAAARGTLFIPHIPTVVAVIALIVAVAAAHTRLDEETSPRVQAEARRRLTLTSPPPQPA